MEHSETHAKPAKDSRTAALVRISLFSVLIAICSWITIPAQIPVTLQTLAIFTTLGILGGKKGTASITIYLLLGAIGLPVFSNFQGGIGVLAGATGGYILGFLLSGLTYWLITGVCGRFCRTKRGEIILTAVAMLSANLVCYVAGTAHYLLIYTGDTGATSVFAALSLCVLPFILPDLIKIGIALFLSRFSDLSRRFGANHASRRRDQ